MVRDKRAEKLRRLRILRALDQPAYFGYQIQKLEQELENAESPEQQEIQNKQAEAEHRRRQSEDLWRERRRFRAGKSILEPSPEPRPPGDLRET